MWSAGPAAPWAARLRCSARRDRWRAPGARRPMRMAPGRWSRTYRQRETGWLTPRRGARPEPRPGRDARRPRLRVRRRAVRRLQRDNEWAPPYYQRGPPVIRCGSPEQPPSLVWPALAGLRRARAGMLFDAIAEHGQGRPCGRTARVSSCPGTAPRALRMDPAPARFTGRLAAAAHPPRSSRSWMRMGSARMRLPVA